MNVIKNYYSAYRSMLNRAMALAMLCFITSGLFAQQITVKGTITDNTGMGLIGASVKEKGTSNGAATDIDGNFTLSVGTNSDLEVSYIGYLNYVENVNGRTTINIVLKEDSQQLDEVVVVGYGVMRKSDVTGSISITKADDMLKQQAFSALDGLKGKASGVNVFSNSGQPGGGSRVMIRGMSTIKSSSEPLYVVDGVAMENFQYVNPNDIERIEVLKDASSAAIYGARGANGVILVTTKRGGETQGKARVSYSGSMSIGTMARYMDLMDADEFVDALVIARENANRWYGKSYSTNPADFLKDPNLFINGRPIHNTDWQKEATRTSVSHNHQLSIQQGDANSSIGAFLNYTDQEGIMISSYMKRLNAKITYDAKPTKWLSTNVNLMINHTWGNEVSEEGGGQVPRRTMIEMVPFFPVKLSDGAWTNSKTISDDMGFEGMANPVHVLKTQDRMRYRTQIFGNAALTFHLLPGLDLKTQFGIDAQKNKEEEYSPASLINISDPLGRAKTKDIEMTFWQEETFLTYLKTMEDHRINLMAGLSWQERVLRYNESETEGFGDDFSGGNNLEMGTTPKPSKSKYEKWAMNSYFLRAGYTFKDRYMAMLTARVDGTSRVGANSQYGFFPSAGLGWLISNEKFITDISAISNLKLHTSYGITGNTDIPVYQSLSEYTPSTVLINGERQPSFYPSRIGNPDLAWEKTHQFDIGIDAGFFKNRLNLDISYYYKMTKDLLLDRPVPHHTGYESVVDNIGEVSNQGLDILISTVNVQTGDFEWSSTINMNYNKNKIEKLGENNEDILPGPDWVSGSQTILRVGKSLSSFWGYERLGVYSEEDKVAGRIPEGKNIGEVIRSDEKKILGNGLPKLTGSFINNFRYKELDLTVDLQFVTGVDVLQQFMHSTEDRFGLTNGLASVYQDAWSPTNQNTLVPALRNAVTEKQSSELDSRWVADGSYLRANLIQLGYNFKPEMLKKLQLSSLRVYFSVQNAFLISSSDFRSYDPEGSSYKYDPTDPKDNQWGQNMFFFQYPKPRTYTIGLTASF